MSNLQASEAERLVSLSVNSFYSLYDNGDGTHTVESCYNVSRIKITPSSSMRNGGIEWLEVRRNK